MSAKMGLFIRCDGQEGKRVNSMPGQVRDCFWEDTVWAEAWRWTVSASRTLWQEGRKCTKIWRRERAWNKQDEAGAWKLQNVKCEEKREGGEGFGMESQPRTVGKVCVPRCGAVAFVPQRRQWQWRLSALPPLPWMNSYWIYCKMMSLFLLTRRDSCEHHGPPLDIWGYCPAVILTARTAGTTGEGNLSTTQEEPLTRPHPVGLHLCGPWFTGLILSCCSS